jgi:hypothetical protein
MRMIFMAHSGVRYLVLLAGFVAVLYLAMAVFTKRPNDRVARILGSTFVGLMDLQVLLGLLMVALGAFYPALMGHLFMMIGAVVVGHVAMKMAKSAAPPRANVIRLAGVVVALILIFGGILAIGRTIFGTGSPSVS